MPVDSILINAAPGETRVALIEQGRLADLAIERAAEPSAVGHVYLGRIAKIVPALQAAFVDLGLPRAGFLELAGARLGEGDAVVVQVVRDSRDQKGPKLTTRLSLPGDSSAVAAAREEIERGKGRAKPPARLWADLDLVRRTLRETAKEAREIVIDDAEAFARAKAFAETILPGLGDRLALHRGPQGLFEAYGIEAEIDAALDPDVPLPSGGRLTIEETTALVAVDVDTGSAEEPGSGRLAKEATALAANREAAGELARQIRLRNLGGLIAVDFVPMRGKGARTDVLDILRRAAEADPVGFDVGGFTRFGLVEMTRRKVGDTLLRQLTVPAGGRRGRIKSPLTLAYEALRKALAVARERPGARIAVRAPAPVVAALTEAAGEARAEVESRLGFRLGLEPDDALAPDRIDVRALMERAQA